MRSAIHPLLFVLVTIIIVVVSSPAAQVFASSFSSSVLERLFYPRPHPGAVAWNASFPDNRWGLHLTPNPSTNQLYVRHNWTWDLSSYHILTGRLQWRHHCDCYLGPVAVLPNGRVFVLAGSNLKEVDPRTGEFATVPNLANFSGKVGSDDMYIVPGMNRLIIFVEGDSSPFGGFPVTLYLLDFGDSSSSFGGNAKILWTFSMPTHSDRDPGVLTCRTTFPGSADVPPKQGGGASSSAMASTVFIKQSCYTTGQSMKRWFFLFALDIRSSLPSQEHQQQQQSKSRILQNCSYLTPQQATFSILGPYDGIMIIQSNQAGTIDGFSAVSGLFWSVAFPCSGSWNCAYSVAADLLLVQYPGTTATNISDGETLWTQDRTVAPVITRGFPFLLVVDNRNLYHGKKPVLSMVDNKNPLKQIWRTNLTYAHNVNGIGIRTGAYFPSSPGKKTGAGLGGTFYLLASAASSYIAFAVDAGSGSVLWSTDVSQFLQYPDSAMVLDSGRFVFFVGDDNIVALNTKEDH